MNGEDFVRALVDVVRDSAVKTAETGIEDPADTAPTVLGPIGDWCSKLTVEDRGNISVLLRYVAHHTLFGMLCVIDGARGFDRTPEGHGRLEVYHVSADESERHLLNSPDEDDLHDVYSFHFGPHADQAGGDGR